MVRLADLVTLHQEFSCAEHHLAAQLRSLRMPRMLSTHQKLGMRLSCAEARRMLRGKFAPAWEVERVLVQKPHILDGATVDACCSATRTLTQSLI